MCVGVSRRRKERLFQGLGGIGGATGQEMVGSVKRIGWRRCSTGRRSFSTASHFTARPCCLTW
jgi:hypothetical protein